MTEPKITTIFLLWNIRYNEAGDEQFKIGEDYMWKYLQQFIKDKDVTSITFYAKGLTERVDNKAYEGHIYEETLTKEEFLQVNEGWLDARKRKLGIIQ